MTFKDVQYNLTNNNGSKKILPDIPVSPHDDNWLNVSSKKDDEMRDKFNTFNEDIIKKIDGMSTSANNKLVFLQIVEIFERDCQLPDKPGLISSLGKLERYSQAQVGQKLYMALMNTAVQPGVSDETRYDILSQLEMVYDGFLKSQEKPSLEQGLKQLKDFLTTFKLPEQDTSIKYNLANQLSFGQELPSGTAYYPKPSFFDYINAFLGTGYLQDFTSYIQENFFTYKKTT